MAVINLIQIGQQLALTGKPIHNAIEKSGKPFELSADKLVAKIPELAKFKESKIFRFYKGESGAYESKTLTLYIDDNGAPAVFTADIKPLEGKVTFTTYKTGLQGYQRFKFEGVEYQAETSLSEDYRDNLIAWGSVEGEGLPDVKYLADVPHFTVPLKDLAKDTEFKILKSTGTDKKFDSVRYLIQNTVTKEEFEVFGNAQMREMFTEYGSDTRFKIGDVKERKPKNGEKPVFTVRLIDLKIPTFEDLVV